MERSKTEKPAEEQHRKGDIRTIEDVRLLVDTFYGRARLDELVGPIFNATIQDRWPEHLAKLYTFWQTILLGQHTYTGSPFMPHSMLPLGKAHFDRWLQLFHTTLNELFTGPTAEEAKQRSVMMAQMFQFRMAEHARAGTTPIR
ncbi:MAG: group III truncated hemoglobin [Flavobacteriales bacterium]|nr:group III truncated hemoglobin [Flavobacteriales bacterium]MCB0757418.1 group III truncated hemoglobin [Flavobacteriales bacterium]